MKYKRLPPIAAWNTWSGAQFSTYRLGGPLSQAFCPMNQDQAVALLDWLCETSAPNLPEFTVLGWGSNSVIADSGIQHPCLIFRKLTEIEKIDATHLRFGAGVHLAKVSQTAFDMGLTGCEFMVGIPGTMGGAVRMNAGATGQETGSLVSHVTLYNLTTGQLETWSAAQLAFSYRHSTIEPGHHVVLSVQLTLAQGDPQAIQALMAKNRQFRKQHHPTEPNGGSVFRNPVTANAAPSADASGTFATSLTPNAAPSADALGAFATKTAGQMLDELGAKSWQEGGVRVSPKHANFIINTGGGSSVEVLRLMRRMQQAVQDAYGIHLRPENLFLGDASEEEMALWAQLTQKNT
ncbi:MAG: UDP-N-acetylmuramate dehydrogenase [Vampirovibrionales bacterium]|nr:UDP-N-acetylmuramate dehydrogenase [Vampirovibrionales bacterium]